MTKYPKLKALKIFKLILLIIYVPVLLFYLAIVLPGFIACVNCNYEGAMGVDIWGNELQCFGESKDLADSFFQLMSFVVVLLFTVLAALFYHIGRLKKKFK